MKALILAGGFATRLRPITDRIPKALLPIGNVPFLEHQIRLLARHGVDDAVLLTGYLAEDFGPFAQRMTRYGVRLEISTEDEPLGTAGALRTKLDELDGTTLVFNGDVLTDIDISVLLKQHRDKEAAITMALSYVPDSGGYGVVQTDEDDRVLAFVQNVKGEPRPGDWINAGIYAIEPRIIARVPPGRKVELEHPPDPVFPALLADGEPFYAMRSDAYWIDIGARDRYLQAHVDVLDGRADVSVEGTLMREDKTLPDGTRIVAPTLLSHAPVGRGAVLGPYACLGQGCTIGERATVERSVVLTGARVGAGATVRGSILGSGATIEPGEECIDDIRA